MARNLTLRAPRSLTRFVAPKGSVALDGMSLTVNKVEDERFSVLIIPHTLQVTTLGAHAPARGSISKSIRWRAMRRGCWSPCRTRVNDFGRACSRRRGLVRHARTEQAMAGPRRGKRGEGARKGARILIVEARYYDEIADALLAGAMKALEEAGAGWDLITVPGSLEIPAPLRSRSTGRRGGDGLMTAPSRSAASSAAIPSISRSCRMQSARG